MSDTTERPYITLINGSTAPYRGEEHTTWNTSPNGGRTFYQHAVQYPDGTGLASAIIAEAWEENANRELPSGNIVFTDEKLEREAAGIGATTEQLARLRVLAEDSRKLVRANRELEQLRVQLQGQQMVISELQSAEITTYDERMRPMLEQLAELAEERNFCSEFDLVLEHINGPSREELKPSSYVACMNVSIHTHIHGLSEDEGIDRDVLVERFYNMSRDDWREEINEWSEASREREGN